MTPERRRQYDKHHRDIKARAVYGYLLEHPCVDCGEDDPVVLEFDHVRGEKRRNISKLFSGTFSLQTVFAEIAKCDVRCANCHRRVTAERGNFLRYLYVIRPKPEPLKSNDWHGTANGYRYHRCRCEKCTGAHRTAVQQFRSRIPSAF